VVRLILLYRLYRGNGRHSDTVVQKDKQWLYRLYRSDGRHSNTVIQAKEYINIKSYQYIIFINLLYLIQ